MEPSIICSGVSSLDDTLYKELLQKVYDSTGVPKTILENKNNYNPFELPFNEMDLVVLNCYRNKYHADGLNTETGVIADSINKVLPLLCKLYNGEVTIVEGSNEH